MAVRSSLAKPAGRILELYYSAMIDVTYAVSAAKVFVANMFPDAADIRLEEVEFSDQSDKWDVVVSFPSGEPKTFATMVSGDRIFKKVILDAVTGSPVALKVFKP